MTFELVEKAEALPLCACGCGQPVTKPGNTYIRGHQGRRRNTGIRSSHRSGIDDDGNVVLHQNMELVQQVLGKAFKGSKESHTINIITVGPIQVENNGHNSQAQAIPGDPLPLQEALAEVFSQACASGELPEDETERRVRWLIECEKVVARP